MLGGAGLTKVATADLTTALRALHRGDIAPPIDVTALARVGLQHCATEMLGTLRRLDADAVRAVLVAVIAERRK